MTDGRSTPLSHTARFECDALAIRGARALVGEMLTREGWAPLDVERARLVVSELVANAVVHARSPFTLSYSYDGVLRVGVTDDDPRSDPHPKDAEPRSYRRHGPAAGGRDQPRLGRPIAPPRARPCGACSSPSTTGRWRPAAARDRDDRP
ncbi:MAG TPA: ATP-binding protein [Acidimicrobiales bacterium]|nr:ATP-binding protein [Acidimicrobiales bacterium]